MQWKWHGCNAVHSAGYLQDTAFALIFFIYSTSYTHRTVAFSTAAAIGRIIAIATSTAAATVHGTHSSVTTAVGASDAAHTSALATTTARLLLGQGTILDVFGSDTTAAARTHVGTLLAKNHHPKEPASKTHANGEKVLRSHQQQATETQQHGHSDGTALLYQLTHLPSVQAKTHQDTQAQGRNVSNELAQFLFGGSLKFGLGINGLENEQLHANIRLPIRAASQVQDQHDTHGKKVHQSECHKGSTNNGTQRR